MFLDHRLEGGGAVFGKESRGEPVYLFIGKPPQLGRNFGEGKAETVVFEGYHGDF